MAGYKLKGQWDPESERTVYGEKYVRFLADLSSITNGSTIDGVGIYLPAKFKKGEVEMVEIELPPGTRIIRMIAFTITVGDPTGLPRDPYVTYEDVDVEGISVRALPAS